VVVISTSVKENVFVLLEIDHYLDYFQFKIKVFSFCGSGISKSDREELCDFDCGGAEEQLACS